MTRYPQASDGTPDSVGLPRWLFTYMYSVRKPTKISLKFTNRLGFVRTPLDSSEGGNEVQSLAGGLGARRTGEVVILKCFGRFRIQPVEAVILSQFVHVRWACHDGHEFGRLFAQIA